MTAAQGNPTHIPVLVDEVIRALQLFPGAVVVDATFGAGGYTRAILESSGCEVVAIDRDPRAIAIARELETEHPDTLTVVEGCFGDMERLLKAQGITRVDGIALDLGVSSMQLDQPERGFSFRADATLDMRMGGTGRTAADVVNEASEKELADIINRYGEERRARMVAREIVAARAKSPITRTGQLAEIVHKVVRRGPNDIDPATRTFQALRIHVNDELGELERGLAAAERLLAPGGRLAVVAFHSLEDRMVKVFLRDRSGAAPRMSRHLPGDQGIEPAPPSFELLFRQSVRPSTEEIKLNPRSRSARLRAAVRTAADPWPDYTTGPSEVPS